MLKVTSRAQHAVGEQVCVQAQAPCRAGWSALLGNTGALTLQWALAGFPHLSWPQAPADHHTSPGKREAIEQLYLLGDQTKAGGLSHVPRVAQKTEG